MSRGFVAVPDCLCGAAAAQEQARALYAMGLLDYGALKGRLTVTTAALVAIGTALTALTGAPGCLPVHPPARPCHLRKEGGVAPGGWVEGGKRGRQGKGGGCLWEP